VVDHRRRRRREAEKRNEFALTIQMGILLFGKVTE
jgi:hypothetical protein